MALFIRHECDRSLSMYNVNQYLTKKERSGGFWNTKAMIMREQILNEVKFISTIEQYYHQRTATLENFENTKGTRKIVTSQIAQLRMILSQRSTPFGEECDPPPPPP